MGRRGDFTGRGIRAIGALLVLMLGGGIFVPQLWGVILFWALLLVAGGFSILVLSLVLKRNNSPNGPGILANAPRIFHDPKQRITNESRAAPSVTGCLDANCLTTEAVRNALRRLDWFQFEKVVAAIYRGYGDAVERLGGAHPDGGVDLIVTAKSGKFVVQCKHWCNWTVGVKNIRELLGTLTTSGIPKGVFVTMRGYSDEARDLGVKHGLVLLDEAQLAKLIVGLGPAHGAEVLALLNDHRKFCPKCENEMVLRTAKRGAKAGKQFWGCPNYPRCDGTLEANSD